MILYLKHLLATNKQQQKQQQQTKSSSSNNNNNKRLLISFSFDYLKIVNDQNQEYGVYCGDMTGQTVLVTGNYAVVVFHSNEDIEERGFLLHFTAVPIGQYTDCES